MKIQCFGARFYGGQVQRIEHGFENFGEKVLPSSNTEIVPDLIYCNDAENYDNSIKLHNHFNKTPKLILNCLDLPYWLNNFDDILKEYKQKFALADRITCISKAVQNQIQQYLGISSDVVYIPIKDVYLDENIKPPKPIFLLYVGRANDIRKNFKLIVDTLRDCGISSSNLTVVGSENPRYGQYLGVVSDAQLNEIYNKSSFLLLPSFFEGAGLSALEASVCGCVPILCSNNPISKEFYPNEFIAEPTIRGYGDKIFELLNNYNKSRELALEYGKKYSQQFSGLQIAKNIIGVFETL